MNNLEEVNLDITSYTFNELLDLFKLKDDFSPCELRNVRKMVMMTHPDKSGLPAEYFRFFVKALDIITRCKYNIDRINTNQSQFMDDRTKLEIEIDGQSNFEAFKAAKILKADGTIGENFNKTFHRLFDEIVKANEEEDDEGERFLKSHEGELPEGLSKEEANKILMRRKKELGALIVNNDYQEANRGYSGNSFGSLHCEDVKKAYTESIVPVDENDYHNRKKYTIEQLRQERGSLNMSDYDYKVGINKFHNKMARDKDEYINNYYEYLKDFENKRELVKKFNANILRLQ